MSVDPDRAEFRLFAYNLAPAPSYSIPMPSSRRSLHFHGAEKYAAVHRILRGESVERVAAELHVSVDRLRRWERIFLEAGKQRLAKHHDSQSGFFRFANTGRRLLPWGGLLLLLIVVVYAASRFFQQGVQP